MIGFRLERAWRLDCDGGCGEYLMVSEQSGRDILVRVAKLANWTINGYHYCGLCDSIRTGPRPAP